MILSPLTAGTPVIIKLGPKHRQFDRLEPFAQYRYIKGTIDWINPHNHKIMEIRINRGYARQAKGQKFDANKDFFIRVEYSPVDCYNFRDVIVIKRVSGN